MICLEAGHTENAFPLLFMPFVLKKSWTQSFLSLSKLPFHIFPAWQGFQFPLPRLSESGLFLWTLISISREQGKSISMVGGASNGLLQEVEASLLPVWKQNAKNSTVLQKKRYNFLVSHTKKKMMQFFSLLSSQQRIASELNPKWHKDP